MEFMDAAAIAKLKQETKGIDKDEALYDLTRHPGYRVLLTELATELQSAIDSVSGGPEQESKLDPMFQWGFETGRINMASHLLTVVEAGVENFKNRDKTEEEGGGKE